MADEAGRIANVTVLAVGEVLTSVSVRNKWGRVIGTMEVYNDGQAVYASTGNHDRALVGPPQVLARAS